MVWQGRKGEYKMLEMKTLTILQNQPEVLTITELASVLRIGKNKAYQLVSSGEIESVKIGCKTIVPSLSVAKFLMTSEDYAMLLSGQSR